MPLIQITMLKSSTINHQRKLGAQDQPMPMVEDTKAAKEKQ
jgi:hypothetical protein